MLRTDVIEVVYYQVDHNREDGTPRTRLEDKHSIRRKSIYQPRIFLELKNWIKTHLSEGFSAKQVYEEHRQNWIEQRKIKYRELVMILWSCGTLNIIKVD